MVVELRFCIYVKFSCGCCQDHRQLLAVTGEAASGLKPQESSRCLAKGRNDSGYVNYRANCRINLLHSLAPACAPRSKFDGDDWMLRKREID